MNILVATGHLAEQTVRLAVRSKADILVIDTDVAAFITPRKLQTAMQAQQASGNLSDNYDLIFVPGLVSGNFLNVAKELGCEIYLGPKHAYDLEYIVLFAGKVEFSTTIPACELLINVRRDMALDTVQKIETNANALMHIGQMKLGGGARMKVMAEVVDATGLDAHVLSDKIISFIKKGADIIDLGASLNATPDDVERAIKTARKVSSVPISIDTLDPELLNRALDIGVDIVLSLNSSNIDKIGRRVADSGTAAVVIPDIGAGVESLVENIKSAQKAGISRVIADPVLDPIGHGIAESIVRYHEFNRQFPDMPLFFGVGNVTELIDADSAGVNAAFCGIAADVGANILFTPEFSNKAQGSIHELKTASEMMILANERDSSPKDLGIDLLVMKEKRRREDAMIPADAIDTKKSDMWRVDPAGCVRIEISPDLSSGAGGKILVRHRDACIVGENASEVLDTLIDMRLVSTLGHAGYLGRELKKAELALQFNRSYAQDDDF
ncbi:MAG TPA: dihydropteroate synthase-like protein [Methanosarcinaceae archaeon]|nr:dihydropteroate synthase-like protein [Methanosarcinaceae archaeon]